MKKVIATILGVILIGTLATGCGGGEEVQLNNAGEPYVAKPAVVERYNSFAKYACDDFWYLIQNADILTFAEQTSKMKDIWVGAGGATYDGQPIPNFEEAGRLFLATAMAGRWEDVTEVGKIIRSICSDIPSP
jgi:hypothetical protein